MPLDCHLTFNVPRNPHVPNTNGRRPPALLEPQSATFLHTLACFSSHHHQRCHLICTISRVHVIVTPTADPDDRKEQRDGRDKELTSWWRGGGSPIGKQVTATIYGFPSPVAKDVREQQEKSPHLSLS